MRRRVTILAYLVAIASTVTVHTVSFVRMHVRFENSAAVPPSIRADLVTETAKIWAPYGVLVDADETGEPDLAGRSLVVVFDLGDAAGGNDNGDNGLGSVRFGRDGLPVSTITLFYGAVVRLVAASNTLGTDVHQWPVRRRDQLVARVLGRTLAHELGHFTLRSPHHASSGLMRARPHAAALVEPSRKGFGLTNVDRARLNIVLSAQSLVARY